MASKKVIVYFEDERDALHFTVAASSVISEGNWAGSDESANGLIEPLARANRIRVSSASAGQEPQAAI